MIVKLINEGAINNNQRNPFVAQVNIPGVQVCYLERYFDSLKPIAKECGATKIEVICHGYIHRGTVDNRLIRMERN